MRVLETACIPLLTSSVPYYNLYYYSSIGNEGREKPNEWFREKSPVSLPSSVSDGLTKCPWDTVASRVGDAFYFLVLSDNI